MRPFQRGFNQSWSNVTEMDSRWEEKEASPKLYQILRTSK